MRMTHLERVLSALYVSEGWYVFWKEHGDVSFKTRSLIAFDRAISCETWQAAAALEKGNTP
jgi:hypothetical protein